jgi:hypothetical protein
MQKNVRESNVDICLQKNVAARRRLKLFSMNDKSFFFRENAPKIINSATHKTFAASLSLDLT